MNKFLTAVLFAGFFILTAAPAVLADSAGITTLPRTGPSSILIYVAMAALSLTLGALGLRFGRSKQPA